MKTHTSFPLIYALALIAAVLPFALPGQTASAADTKARAMTPKDVARTRSVTSVALSPKGDTIAYTLSIPRTPGAAKNGPAHVELHIASFDGSVRRPFITGDVSIRALEWMPDGSALTYLAKRGDDEHTSLYLIPADGGESRRIVDHASSIKDYALSPDGRRVAFVAAEPVDEDKKKLKKKGFNQKVYEEDWRPHRVYIADIATDPGADLPEAKMLEDVQGHPFHVEWHPDGKSLLIDPAPTPLVDDQYMYRRIKAVDTDSGKVLSEIANPGKLGRFAWSADGKTVAMISAADIHDPREGRLMTATAQSPKGKDLLPGLEGHVMDFRFTRDGKILYLSAEGVGTRIGRIGIDGNDDETLYASDSMIVTAISASPTGHRLALLVESADHPKEVYTFVPGQEKRLTRSSDSNPWLAEIKMGRQSVFEWKASDGWNVQGVLIEPVSRKKKRRVPLIVVPHGGPEAHFSNGWLTRYSYPGQVAAGMGYAVLYPNYRSSTARGVAFSKAGQGDAAGREFDDVLDGMDALIAEGLVDRDRIGITGGSYGGFFTAWGATKHSDRFAAGVMFVGISNQLSKAGTTDIAHEMQLVHWRSHAYDALDLFMERSPILYVKQSKTPLLILHGEDDPRVHPGQSKELFRAFKVIHEGRVPVRLVLYPGEGHGNRRAAARYDYNLRMMRWFEHFLRDKKKDVPPYEVEYDLDE